MLYRFSLHWQNSSGEVPMSWCMLPTFDWNTLVSDLQTIISKAKWSAEGV